MSDSAKLRELLESPGETFESVRMRDGLRRRMFGEEGTPVRLGRYRIDRLIGRGGMGSVYAAHDPELDRPVAIKLLHGDTSEAATQRLQREAEALAAIAHPNVVAVYEVGKSPRGLFVVMELVVGRSLAQWLAQPRPWGARRFEHVLELLLQAGRGLAAAHEVGLVHRDFKPANVLVGEDARGAATRVRVADFGLARPLLSAIPERTELGATAGFESGARSVTDDRVGTPAYMAPEQLDGEQVDARCDQFAFCVAAWEAIYGERPFGGETLVARRIAIDSGVQLRLRRPGVHRSVAAVLARGLDASPARRWPHMRALLDRLDQLRRSPALAMAASGTGLALVIAAVAAASPARERSLAMDPCAQGDSLPSMLAEAPAGASNDERARVDTALSFHAARYDQAWARACAEASPEARALQLACLLERRDEIELVASELQAEPERLGERGITAIDELHDPEACNDVERLHGGDPHDALHRDLSAALASARAANRAGRPWEAIALAVAVHAQALAAARPHLDARARLELGAFASVAGDSRNQREWYVDAYDLATRAGDDESAALAAIFVLRDVGWLTVDDAMTWRRHAESAMARLGSAPRIEAEYWRARGSLALHRGDAEEAERCHRRALELTRAREGGDTLASVADLVGIGEARQMSAHDDEALVWFGEALELAERTAGPRHSVTLAVQGALAQALGNTDPARARAIFEQLLVDEPAVLGEDSEDHAITLMSFAALELREGRLEQAVAHMHRSRAILERSVGAQGRAVAMLRFNLGTALQHAGDFAGAQTEIAAALELFERQGDVGEIMQVAVGLATVAMERDDDAFALATLERTATRFGKGDGDGRLAQLLYFLAVAQLETGAAASARDTLDRAQPMIAESYGAESYRMGELLTLRGDLAEHGGDVHRAIADYDEGVRIMAAARPLQHSSVGYAQYRLAQLHWSIGNRRHALAHARAALATFDDAGQVATSRDEVEAWLAAHDDARSPRGTKTTGPQP